MTGVYVHIPFCRQRCAYCDFYSEAGRDNLIPAFLDAVHREIRIRTKNLTASERTVDTVYFGGGTPTLLGPKGIKFLLAEIWNAFDVADDAELTIETNPATVTRDDLTALVDMGVNRISIGCQSFDDTELKLLGRIHTAKEAEHIVHSARKAGFADIGLDLIFGLPGQNMNTWKKSLDCATALEPTHVSTYALTWSDATPLGQQINAGRLPSPEEDTLCDMLLTAAARLAEQGFEHYEVSNFAQPDRRSRHNEGYWTGKQYYGFGPSAHTFSGTQRWWNLADIAQYITVLSHNCLPTTGSESVDPVQKRLEQIALGLRRKEGIPLSLIRDKMGVVQTLVSQDIGQVMSNTFSLTATGFLLADAVALELA